MPNREKSAVGTVKPNLLLDNQLCFALYSASRAMTRFYAPALKKLGLTYPQYLALMVLWEQEGQTIQSLANQLEIDQATTTPLVQRLEKTGFVRRERSSEDERRVQVWLTEKGKSVYEEADNISMSIACSSGMTAEQATAIINQMRAMKAALNAA